MSTWLLDQITEIVSAWESKETQSAVPWSEHDTVHLFKVVQKMKDSKLIIDWQKVSDVFKDKSALVCKRYYYNMVRRRPDLANGVTLTKYHKWSQQDQERLQTLYVQYSGDWDSITQSIGRRKRFLQYKLQQ